MSRLMRATLDAKEHLIIEVDTRCVFQVTPTRDGGSYFEYLGALPEGAIVALLAQITREVKRWIRTQRINRWYS